MSAVYRGTRNAFRNPLRTVSVITILGISLGLVMVMLAARAAVDKRIIEVKGTVGNIVTVSPAGVRGFIGGGEPLTTTQVGTLEKLAHVTAVDVTIDAQLRTGTDTTLQSATEAGTLGGRGFRVFNDGSASGQTDQLPTDFTPPIMAVGTNNADYAGGMVGSEITLTSGESFDAIGEAKEAFVGQSLAEKNGLTVGSTFTAYGQEIKVVGIYDAGNDFANNTLVMPLKTLQTLSDQVDQITSAIIRVDSADNLASVTATAKTELGDAADVTSSSDTISATIEPLANIKTIATTSLYGALGAAAIITLLTMVMIVRERRKEIAVLKAIGAGDGSIVTQFVGESVIFSLLGGAVGSILGVVLSNPILSTLMKTSTQDPVTQVEGGPPGQGVVRVMTGGWQATRGAIENLQANVNLELILYGFLAAVAVAIIGSAFPAWLISKVRPAEVLRSE